MSLLIRAHLRDSLANYAGMTSKDGIVRILEIGAGTGSTTVQCIECLREMKIPFQYTFTDISQYFLNEAKNKLNNAQEVAFQIFNIEEDPLSQGFAPSEFDIIIGVQVVHATANLFQSIRNLKRILRVNGLLLLGEGLRPHASQLFIFGLLDGWWRFNDFRVNSKMTALLDEAGWTSVLNKSGFDNVCSHPGFLLGVVAARNTSEVTVLEGMAQRKKWLIFKDASPLCSSISSKLEYCDRELEVIDTTGAIVSQRDHSPTQWNPASFENDNLEGVIYFCTEFEEKDIVRVQEQIVSPLLTIFKAYAQYTGSRASKSKIVLVTRGVYAIGDSDPGNPNGATAWGMLKVFRNEHPYVNMCLIDLDPNPSKLEAEQVLSQVWNHDGECFLAFRNQQTFVLRLTYLEKPALSLQLPLTDRFKLNNPESGAFTDIEVGPRPKPELGEDCVEIEVRACALNFRDIFMVLKPEGFSLPDDNSLGTLDSVGLDVSGVVVAVGPNVKRLKLGDKVFGMTYKGALGSHTTVEEQALLRIPETMTYVEACTIPCVFVTVHVSLINVAKLKASDRVLIHVGTGGVGLAAIQVAKHIGAEIYATAGSKRKRAYLRYLGIKYVYNSRNTDYGEGIERDTNGQGVTVVLNSLTGPNFKETTLKASGHSARFLEIAKINIWSPEEVYALRPDVQYTIVDLSTKEGLKTHSIDGSGNATVLQEIENYIDKGIYSGLPNVVFQLSQVREAFYYFQKALHIGKVVVQMPKYTLSATGKPEHKIEIFNEQSTYLITGGLGGIGIEVTKWMRTIGARTIVLLGRSPPKENVQRLIEQWNREGSCIVVMNGDVGEYGDCEVVLKIIQTLRLPQLRGIMHAAGVLSDNFIEKQTFSSMQTVLRPKVYGGWYLHSLTLNYPLEFFVMFSSVSGILGMVAQCNHAGANRMLDSLTHYRLAMGLPASTINWGGWSDVGAAAHITSTVEAITGLRVFTPAQGIAALQIIMTSREAQVAVGEVTDWNIVKKLFSQGRYFDEMKSTNVEGNRLDAHAHLIEEIKLAGSTEERQEKVQVYIEAILKQTLNLPESEAIDLDQNFSTLGVDSLMAMEMKNRFQAIVGNRTLTITALQENPTIRSLSAHLAQLMDDSLIESRTVAVAEQVQMDVVLPSDICASPNSVATLNSDFTTILFTGATGHLGVHCLVQLLESPKNLTLHCLIRAKTNEEAGERLQKTLDKYGISNSSKNRLIVMAGDVTKDMLGLSEQTYEMLTREIDGIFHCAAKVNQSDGYMDGSLNDMRTHNVVGLVNILRFSVKNKTKSIFHASTLWAATKVSSSGQVVEDFPNETDIITANLDLKQGYLLSKFIGERLLREARIRGIPVKVIRFPFILGDGRMGGIPVGQEHLWSTILSCIRTRMIPEGQLNGVPIVAVDQAASIASHLFLSDTAEDGMYNLAPNSVFIEDSLVEGLTELGMSCKFVSLKEWATAVSEIQDQNLEEKLEPIDKEGDGGLRITPCIGLSKDTDHFETTYCTDRMIRNIPQSRNLGSSAKDIVKIQIQAYLAGGALESKR